MSIKIAAQLLFILGLAHLATAAVKCLRDKSLGSSYEANVYYCEDDDKPVCCEEDNEHTCCEDDNKKTWREQLQLWGALGSVVIIIAIVIICWRKDSYICEGATMKERCSICCCILCRKSKKKKQDTVRIRISRKYQKPADETTGISDNSPYHSSKMTSNAHLDDIDSGRGSVASSAPSLYRSKRPDSSIFTLSHKNDVTAVRNKHAHAQNTIPASHTRFDETLIDPVPREVMQQEYEMVVAGKQSKGGDVRAADDVTVTQQTTEAEYESRRRKKKKKKKSKKAKRNIEHDAIL